MTFLITLVSLPVTFFSLFTNGPRICTDGCKIVLANTIDHLMKSLYLMHPTLKLKFITSVLKSVIYVYYSFRRTSMEIAIIGAVFLLHLFLILVSTTQAGVSKFYLVNASFYKLFNAA